VGRYRAVTPISSISVEAVRFDMQKLENPEISGIEYQNGTLAGYECREYLLEKWGRKCAYCDAENVPLEIDHIHPKGRRGSDRISNLTLACRPCNEAKGCQPVEWFLASKPEKLKRILAQSKRPLDAAAAVNSTRTALVGKLRETRLPLYAGRVGVQSLTGKLSGCPKRMPWMLPVLALSQAWAHGTCRPFASRRKGADLTNAPRSAATVSPAVI
jgi:hypothetical protein